MQLHAAAARGDLAGIEFALKAGAQVNCRNRREQTPLVFALERARGFSHSRGPRVTPSAVEALLDAGADLTLKDHLGSTAIHHAASIPDPRFLDLLIARGGDPRHVTQSGYSVLLQACFQPSSLAKRAIMQRLIEAGARLEEQSSFGEFPLAVCLRFGDLETLRLLLDAGVDSGPLQWTELHHLVALKEQADIVRYSPSSARISAPNAAFELSPWLLAFVRGDLLIIKELAERGADLTQTDRFGATPLHLAAEFGHASAIHWLLDLGMEPDIMDNFGRVALENAAEWNQIQCAKVLLEGGAEAAFQNSVQAEAIHAAYTVEMLNLLVESGGSDVNAISGSGDWPLKSAAQENDMERVQWLLGHGAQVDRTSTGETALHPAVAHDSREAVDLLLGAGADPNAQDVDGWTPLHSAQSCETIETLLQAGADPTITDMVGQGAECWINDPILLRALRGNNSAQRPRGFSKLGRSAKKR